MTNLFLTDTYSKNCIQVFEVHFLLIIIYLFSPHFYLQL